MPFLEATTPLLAPIPVISSCSRREDVSRAPALPEAAPNDDLLNFLHKLGEDPEAFDPNTSLKQQQPHTHLALDSRARARVFESCLLAKASDSLAPAPEASPTATGASLDATLASPGANASPLSPASKRAHHDPPEEMARAQSSTAAAATAATPSSSTPHSTSAVGTDAIAANPVAHRRISHSSRRHSARHSAPQHRASLDGAPPQFVSVSSPSASSDASHSSNRVAVDQSSAFRKSSNQSLIFGGIVHSLKFKDSSLGRGRGIPLFKQLLLLTLTVQL